MKKRKTNPKVQNTLLLIACIVLFLILGSLLFFNHKKEAANSSELKKAAQEEIQKEKSDQTWTGEFSCINTGVTIDLTSILTLIHFVKACCRQARFFRI